MFVQYGCESVRHVVWVCDMYVDGMHYENVVHFISWNYVARECVDAVVWVCDMYVDGMHFENVIHFMSWG